MVGVATDHVQVIKKSIAFRAKYRAKQGEGPTLQRYSPALAVPHPKNRGGDGVKSLRTKQLTSSIARDGCDPIEGNSNAVAVEDHPDDPKFQKRFQEQVKSDPHMCKKIGVSVAAIGTLSHSHFNCAMRNMLDGQKGCECSTVVEVDGVVVEEAQVEECTCGNKDICNKHGQYSMGVLRSHDVIWAELCETGILWEVLSHTMDIEEPEAAMIIALALNRKNEASMGACHTEIMNTLVGLCKPGPSGEVPFAPVQNKMVELYSSAVDYPDFVNAFRLVMEAGGAESPHMHDLKEFTQVCVNPKKRDMRFEIYSVVTEHPKEFPRIRNAMIKWSWRTTPQRGYCQLPPNISGRFKDAGSQSMVKAMRDIEGAFSWFGKVATQVQEKIGREKAIKFVGGVEIDIMSKVFAVPKVIEEGYSTLSHEEMTLKMNCAQYLAKKLVKLLHECKENDKEKNEKRLIAPLPIPFPSDNSILASANRHYDEPEFIHQVLSGAKTDDKSTVVEDSVPRVAKLDSNGVPINTEQESTTKDQIEVLQWQMWKEKQGKANTNLNAKALAFSALYLLDDEIKQIPVAMCRRNGKEVYCKAKTDIDIGDLQIPLTMKFMNSLVTVASQDEMKHPIAVPLEVSWQVTDLEKKQGVEQDNHILHFRAVPEFNLPKPAVAGKEPEWMPQHLAHLFWGIQRQVPFGDPWNCEIQFRLVVPLMTAAAAVKSPIWTHGKADAIINAFSVRVPIIVNTVALKADDELILKWKWPANNKKKTVETKRASWVEDALNKEKAKKRRT